MAELSARIETWPLDGAFRIARGARTEAKVVVATLRDGPHVGHGEGTPYARYGETPEATLQAIEAMAPALRDGANRGDLTALMPAGAARNALDCALWDLEAKRHGKPAWMLADLEEPRPTPTAFTISLDAPEAMAAAAARAAARPLLKIKLGGGDDADVARVAAVRAAAPAARLVVDANEGWSLDELRRYDAPLADLGVELIEQPLKAGEDGALTGVATIAPLCADESFHDRSSFDQLNAAYGYVNIKLDKTGGLTEAIAAAAAARDRGLGVFLGCMVATSLAMAPAFLLARQAAYVDLDGPLLMARDRDPAITYDDAAMHPPPPALWG